MPHSLLPKIMKLKYALCLSAFCFFSTSAIATELQLEISGFEATTGTLFVSVFDNKKDWLTERQFAEGSVVVADVINEGKVHVSFELAPGEYAVSIYQDVNNNGKMDTRRIIPIPTEPIGLSNNILPKFGPPKFKQTKFLLGEEDLMLLIELQ